MKVPARDGHLCDVNATSYPDGISLEVTVRDGRVCLQKIGAAEDAPTNADKDQDAIDVERELRRRMGSGWQEFDGFDARLCAECHSTDPIVATVPSGATRQAAREQADAAHQKGCPAVETAEPTLPLMGWFKREV